MSSADHPNGSRPAGFPRRAAGLRGSWRRLRWSLTKRLRPGRTVRLPFDVGLQIDVRQVDRIGRQVYLNGYSDREHALLLHRYLRPGMCYFDVGAHIGQFTLVAASRVGSAGAVHAFEATPDTHRQLAGNVALNGLDWVRTTHAAVHDHAGEMMLNVCGTDNGAFNALGKPLRPAEDVVGALPVTTLTLDDYCREQGVEGIDLMKIDTNGAELHVLRGGRAMLSGPDAPPIVCEFNDVTTGDMGYTTRELRDEFETLGYRLHRLDADARQLEPEPPEATYPETVDLVATKDPDAMARVLQT